MMQRPSGAVIVGVGAVALLVALWAGVASYGASEYARGRQSVTDTAEAVPASVAVVRGADSTAKAATDTVVKRITVTRWKVDTLVHNLPDSIQVVPEVRELVRNVYTLTAQVDTLTHTLDVERATSRLRASVDSAALVSARVVIVQQQDQITDLSKRPTRNAQAITGAISTGIGVVFGVLLLKE